MVVVAVVDTGTGATDLAHSRVPVPGHHVHVHGLHSTDAEVVRQETHTAATDVSRFVEEEATAVVLHFLGPVTITTALHALVRVLGPRFVVVETDHFRQDGARPATPEAGMVAGEGQGVTLCVPAGHVRGRTLGQDQGLAPCRIRVLQDIHGAGVVLGPTAEEGEPGAGAEAEMIFGTAGPGRLSSAYTNFYLLFCQIKFLCLCLYDVYSSVPDSTMDALDPIQLFMIKYVYLGLSLIITGH